MTVQWEVPPDSEGLGCHNNITAGVRFKAILVSIVSHLDAKFAKLCYSDAKAACENGTMKLRPGIDLDKSGSNIVRPKPQYAAMLWGGGGGR